MAMTEQIQSGPLKGIYVSEQTKDAYENVLEDMDWFREKPDGNFVYFSECPYAYLYVDKQYASHSGWSGQFQTQCVMDASYYRLHPEKAPDYIYLEKDYAKLEEVSAWGAQNGFYVEELSYGYALCRTQLD